VAVKFGQGEFVGEAAFLVEERQVALFFPVRGRAGAIRAKIGDDDVTRDFVPAVRVADEIADISECLGLRLAEVFATGFVFDEQHARPEEVNAPVVAGDFLYGFLEAGDDAAFDTEDLEKLVPEGLFSALSLLTPAHSRENLIAL